MVLKIARIVLDFLLERRKMAALRGATEYPAITDCDSAAIIREFLGQTAGLMQNFAETG